VYALQSKQVAQHLLKMKFNYYADVFDISGVLVFKRVYVGKYKSKTWALHKICSMYPDYHNFELYIETT
jgi:hypothetical protein